MVFGGNKRTLKKPDPEELRTSLLDNNDDDDESDDDCESGVNSNKEKTCENKTCETSENKTSENKNDDDTTSESGSSSETAGPLDMSIDLFYERQDMAKAANDTQQRRIVFATLCCCVALLLAAHLVADLLVAVGGVGMTFFLLIAVVFPGLHRMGRSPASLKTTIYSCCCSCDEKCLLMIFGMLVGIVTFCDVLTGFFLPGMKKSLTEDPLS